MFLYPVTKRIDSYQIYVRTYIAMKTFMKIKIFLKSFLILEQSGKEKKTF